MSKLEDDTELSVKESLLLKSLIVFYKKRDNLNILLQFLKSKQRRLSLRLLDWLVTNYAKNHPIMIQYKSNTVINTEFMYLAYKNHLKSFSKKIFDAFARRQHVFYTFDHHVYKICASDMNSHYDRTDGFITSVAQLNAFRFFISSGVVDYAIQHLEEVEKDMVNSHSKNSKDCSKKQKTCTDFQSCVTYSIKMTVRFK